MRFLQSTFLLANVLGLAAGIALPQTPAPTADVSKVDVDVDSQAMVQFRVYYCQHYNWGPPCVLDSWNGSTGGCHKVIDGFRHSISSIGPDPNIFCVLYHNTQCTGDGLLVPYPGVTNLQNYPPINDDVQAMRCKIGSYPRLLDASEVAVLE